MKEKVSQAIIVVRYSCHEVVFLPRTYFCNAKLYSKINLHIQINILFLLIELNHYDL